MLLKTIKRAAAVAAAVLLLNSCTIGEPDSNMDTYQYDGYLNAQWGSTPAEVLSQLQLSKNQWVRLDDEQIEDMPEGTFGYEIVRATMQFGLYLRTELYFAESLEGVGDQIGLYAMKITFVEDPEYYSSSDLSQCDDDFKLNGEDAIAEYQARALYNRNVCYGSYTDENGSWDTISWYCDATLDSVEIHEETRAAAEEMMAALDGCLSMWGETFATLADDPLSSATIFYNNPDAASYVLFCGLPAAVLQDAE